MPPPLPVRSIRPIGALLATRPKPLNVTVLAAEGAELVHLYVDLMNARAPYDVLRDAIHIHPTLAEAMQSAVAEL